LRFLKIFLKTSEITYQPWPEIGVKADVLIAVQRDLAAAACIAPDAGCEWNGLHDAQTTTVDE